MQPYAIRRLASVADEPEIKEKIVSMADRMGKEDVQAVKDIFAQRAMQEN